MNMKNTISKIAAIMLVVFSFVGCEQDQDTIGTDIIGEPGFNADLYDDAEITARNNKLAPVQTNNLPVNLVGAYNDGIFGVQTANFLTQVSLTGGSPNFGTEPVLDSVVLTIPYFHTEEEPNNDGSATYDLDSIYGSGPIKLSVHESGYFLNDFDPDTDFESAQKYYSDIQDVIENNLTGNVLFESQNFMPSSSEIVYFEMNNESGERDTVRQAPHLRIKLAVDFFQEKIIEKEGSLELSSNSNFKNYFRGIYFKAESINGNGSLMMLDLTDNSAITLYYRTQEVTDGESTEAYKSYSLGLGPNMVNTFDQNIPEYNSDNLYLKGGEGSMAVIELFSGVDTDDDGVSDELEDIRENDWLINEANLIFHVNQEILSGGSEPTHVYLYNLDVNNLLADYALDDRGEENAMNSISNRSHLVPLERDEDGNGIKYKIRITQHINQILNNNADNVNLGLVVSQNFNEVSLSDVRNSPDSEVQTVPVSSVISPEGTVVYGPDAADEEKRLKLRIYYTESKE